MATLGIKSKERLLTCHPDLQLIVEELVLEMDITVLCGTRGEAEQNEAFRTGKSKLKFPNSKHNSLPSKAVDLAPYPIDWNNIKRFDIMMDIAQKIADKHGIKIRLGRTFSFKDYPHMELV
jgi:peptidoglycan L-alanyl-D-glutamate endopeptidase CwlK